MPLRQPIDWEAVYRDFRAGILSVREVGALHHVSHVSIIRKAQKHGWVRDLSKRVRDEITRKVATSSTTKITVVDEEQIIEEAASQALAIIKKHRVAIAKLDDAKTKLVKELHNRPTKLWVGQYQGKIITKVVGIAVTERATALLALAGVEERRIRLERQAFGIADEANPGGERITEIPIVFDSAGEKQ